MSNRPGIARVAGLVLMSGALVAAASLSSTSLPLAAPSERAGLPRTSDVLVEQATLICPGQSRQGGEGLRGVPGAVSATAAVPPTQLIARPDGAPSSGSLTLRTIPAGSTLATSAEAAGMLSARIADTVTVDALAVDGEGALAPGLAAAQAWLHAGDDDRGLAVTPCTLPAADLWLIGGGDGPSRTERLVLTNPGANAVSVRVEVLGAKGRVAAAQARSVSIPPRSRAVVSVDALAPDQTSPAVHVVASGGAVSGVLVDSWIDGATGRGTDDATPSASPATDLVVPGVDVAGEALVRLANPGAVEALVQVRLLTPAGAAQVDSLRAIRVPARSTVDVPLSGVAKGQGGLRIVSDQPVTAGAWVERRATEGDDRMGDFGWVPATAPVRVLGGHVLAARDLPRATHTLALATGGAGASVEVTTVNGSRESTRTVVLKPDSFAGVELDGASRVWVTPTAGEVHAAVMVSGADGEGPFYSVAAVQSGPVTALSVPVRQVAN